MTGWAFGTCGNDAAEAVAEKMHERLVREANWRHRMRWLDTLERRGEYDKERVRALRRRVYERRPGC